MKKYALIAVLAIGLLSFSQVLAAGPAASAGILPDSKFYFLDQFGEWFQNIFTFSAKGKAELAVKRAQERIAEVQALLEKDGPQAHGLDTALAGLTSAEDSAQAAVAKVSDQQEKSDLARQATENFNEISKTTTEILGQQIKNLIENFKPEKEALQKQIKDAVTSGNKTLAAQLRDQLVTKENDLRDQINALQEKFQQMSEQTDAVEKDLEDSLDQGDKQAVQEQQQEDLKQQAEQAREAAKTQLEMIREQTKDLQEHLRLDHPEDSQSSQDLKDLQQQKTDLEKEVND